MRRVELVNLQAVLASLYRTNARALEIADQAGLPTEEIEQQARPKSTWWELLREAQRRGCLKAIIDIARAEYPTHQGLSLAASGNLTEIEPDESEAIRWTPPDLTSEEVVVGNDELLPAMFLEVGARAAKCVVRISLDGGGSGSGFLIANDLVLTNRHVLPTKDDAVAAEIRVDVYDSLDGVAFAGTILRTQPDVLFYADDELDWALVKVTPTEAPPASLDPIATVKPKDRVFIVQHPGGLPKQVALGVNTVMHVDGTCIQYLTDTMPGSSGSPIFDRTWRLVGIHRAGGWLTEPNSKALRFRNEGIPIGPIRDKLRARKFIP